MNTLDEIFADVLHIKNTPAKKAAPIDPLVKLQKAMDQLTGMGADRCDLSKVDARTPATPESDDTEGNRSQRLGLSQPNSR